MCQPTVNQTAFLTATTLGVTTVALGVTAALTASTVGTVALGVLAVATAAVSIASMTAWLECKDNGGSPVEYFQVVKDHAAYALVGFIQLAAQTVVQALIQGLASGVSTRVRRKIAGPDVVFG